MVSKINLPDAKLAQLDFIVDATRHLTYNSAQPLGRVFSPRRKPILSYV
jgi:hypothetical protein